MSALGLIQRALETIYDLDPAPPVDAYLVGAAARRALPAGTSRPEELFVVERDGAMEIGLYLDPRCLAALGRLTADPPAALLDGLLPDFAIATEGVSHFLYLAGCARAERSVTSLELEVQAEVDKFATALLHLWRVGERRRSAELVHRLFERVAYRAKLNREERDRYRTANRLARGYCRYLDAAFVGSARLDALLAALRRAYRLYGQDKLAHLAARS